MKWLWRKFWSGVWWLSKVTGITLGRATPWVFGQMMGLKGRRMPPCDRDDVVIAVGAWVHREFTYTFEQSFEARMKRLDELREILVSRGVNIQACYQIENDLRPDSRPVYPWRK